MITKLKISGLILIAIGVVSIYVLDNNFLGFPTTQTATIPDQVNNTIAWVELPITIQYLSGQNTMDGVREKKITVGDTEIQFTVGVEKGIEETPSPGVLRALNEAGYYKPYNHTEAMKIRFEGPLRVWLPYDDNYYTTEMQDWYERSKIHKNDQLKKEHIDSTFTCDNYHELAWKFAGENMWAVGYGDVEAYIYAKAINECINPTHQEEIDKVYAELAKVNADE